MSRWKAAALAGTLSIELGPFRAGLRCDRGGWRYLAPHLAALYGGAQFDDAPRLCDQRLTVAAPSRLRSLLRPQVTGMPGFDLPLIPLPQTLAPLAFEMAWNAAIALDSYRFLILHAAVVIKDGGAVIIPADSGGGKSTLAAALMEAGCAVLSDEFALIDTVTGLVHGFPRPISLKNASLDLFDRVLCTYHDTPKGRLGYMAVTADSIKAPQSAWKPAEIITPKYGSATPNMWEAIPTEKAVLQLLQGSPNYHALGEVGYQALMRLATAIPMHALHYQTKEQSVSMIMNPSEGGRRANG